MAKVKIVKKKVIKGAPRRKKLAGSPPAVPASKAVWYKPWTWLN